MTITKTATTVVTKTVTGANRSTTTGKLGRPLDSDGDGERNSAGWGGLKLPSVSVTRAQATTARVEALIRC